MNGGENLEEAIAAYEKALTVMRDDAQTLERGQLLANLGNLYSVRRLGHRDENLGGCLGFELATIPRMTPESLKQPPRTTPCPAAREFIPRSPLTLHQFARFYAPLAATSLLLTLTNPLLTSALSRSVNPALTLAGFGVAFSLCGVLYSPLLVGQQVAATKLLSGLRFGPIQNFWLRIGGLCSLVAVAVAFTPVGEWVFGGVMGVSGDIFDEARAAIALLAPVPLLTAVRAVHQGRLVAGHRTNLIAVATGARTAVVALVAVVLTRSTPGGAWVGAAAFTTGLLVETILVAGARAGAEGASHPVAAEGVEPGATDDRLLRFSAPLMVNVLLWWSTPVLINSVLARSPFPAEAIAAFVVVEGVAWFLAAPVGQYQHVSIGLVDCKHAHRTLQRWSYLLATAVALLIAAVSIPQVRRAALGAVFGLDAGLLTDIGAALPLAVAYPLLYGHRQYYQGLFTRSGHPDAVGWGAALRVASVLAVAVMGLGPLGQAGATLGVLSAVVGLAVEAVFLERVSRRQVLSMLPESRPTRQAVLSGEGVR
jgi:progressive ankylosis protein